MVYDEEHAAHDTLNAIFKPQESLICQAGYLCRYNPASFKCVVDCVLHITITR